MLSYLRRDGERWVVVVLNFTPVPRSGYRIGVPVAGCYRERLNSDAGVYGGSDSGNASRADSQPLPWMGRSHSLALSLPPLEGLILAPETNTQPLD